MITTELFHANLKRACKTLFKRIRAFRDDPSPDNVHDLRTSSRRLLACIQLLPGRVRKKRRTQTFSIALDELIRRNAAVRDIDIISSKISSRQNVSGQRPLLNRLERQRVKKLNPSLRLVSKMRKKKVPSTWTRRLSDEGLQGRLAKVNHRLESKIKKRLPLVLEDPARKRDLHRLREDSRRLRYLLELSGSIDTSESMTLLRSWQDILGLIHDSDIMIDYLQTEKLSPEVQDLLQIEVSERNNNYSKFASMATTRLALKLSEQQARQP